MTAENNFYFGVTKLYNKKARERKLCLCNMSSFLHSQRVWHIYIIDWSKTTDALVISQLPVHKSRLCGACACIYTQAYTHTHTHTHTQTTTCMHKYIHLTTTKNKIWFQCNYYFHWKLRTAKRLQVCLSSTQHMIKKSLGYTSGNSSVGRVTNWKAWCYTDVGLSPLCGKGFFFPS